MTVHALQARRLSEIWQALQQRAGSASLQCPAPVPPPADSSEDKENAARPNDGTAGPQSAQDGRAGVGKGGTGGGAAQGLERRRKQKEVKDSAALAAAAFCLQRAAMSVAPTRQRTSETMSSSPAGSRVLLRVGLNVRWL